jgi:hypothetical protein
LANSFHFFFSSKAASHLLLSIHLNFQLFSPSLLFCCPSLYLNFLLHFRCGLVSQNILVPRNRLVHNFSVLPQLSATICTHLRF